MCMQIPPIEKQIELWLGDSQELLTHIEDDSIDSIVTDPPYGISFMQKNWDRALPPLAIWKECMRVLKPGGYIVAMSASRTYHRLAVQLEDLGLICHPMIGWIYGSGFPKATDLSKQFDKQAGAERDVVGVKRTKDIKRNVKEDMKKGKTDRQGKFATGSPSEMIDINITNPSTNLAKKWNGYKYSLQALKPALEPIAVFQKPWKCKDVKRMTDNIVKHGVGAFNIDACRVESGEDYSNVTPKTYEHKKAFSTDNGWNQNATKMTVATPSPQGRHPANLLHDGSECVEETFLEQGGVRKSGSIGPLETESKNEVYGKFARGNVNNFEASQGTASRFFNKLPISDLDAPFLYQAKASKRERGEGNDHPTVKSIALMEWLIKLVTPEGGTTLDPFMGSGTTGIAAKKNNFRFIGMEMGEHNYEIAERRISEVRGIIIEKRS